VLGVIVADDLDLNQEMINQNLAVAYSGQSKDDIEAAHMLNREKLIEAGIFTPTEG
jgi:endonuclease YncB( thermonuclease family)